MFLMGIDVYLVVRSEFIVCLFRIIILLLFTVHHLYYFLLYIVLFMLHFNFQVVYFLFFLLMLDFSHPLKLLLFWSNAIEFYDHRVK